MELLATLATESENSSLLEGMDNADNLKKKYAELSFFRCG
jgi:hypothetical protein